ncbi:MAG: hypothetical protein QGG42_11005 [Phycisphaerae bacterium]|jgi:hypothetical protein|nr:hypothetical protein [Phycisphaerae bacterium]
MAGIAENEEHHAMCGYRVDSGRGVGPTLGAASASDYALAHPAQADKSRILFYESLGRKFERE